MNRIGWWLVEIASRALEAQERDAVRGDLAESGETAGQALGGVLGLVLRRQAALWKDWRPWAVLTALIVPLAMLLSVMSRITAAQSATYTWLYANNWDWALLRYAEFWYELRDSIVFLFMRCFPLVCWSWTAGFVLGSVSRRLAPTNALLFCLALLSGELFAAPRYVAWWGDYVRRRIGLPLPPDQHDPISGLGFYKAVFPLLIVALLVAIPSLWGMRRSVDLGRLKPLLHTAIWTAAIVTLGVLVIQEPGAGFLLAAYRYPEIWQSWHIRVLQMVVYWPAAYLISNVIARYWRRIHA
jgi:hypothetical protein